MLREPTMDKLREMRLHGMLMAFEEQQKSSEYKKMSFNERLGIMVDREMTERADRKLQSRLKRARFKHKACMEDINYRYKRSLNKPLMKSLANCKWIKENLNVLITGPSGAGKSYLSCALGHRACLDGYTVRYFRRSTLFSELIDSRGDGSYAKLINSIAKTDLLIIDDWGLTALSEEEQIIFLDILEDRYEIHSTIITSQFPVETWHEQMKNPTLADAILDRLVHNSYKFDLDGGSLRKENSILT